VIGETLSHFRITAKLGKGGMGEVYRAEDTNLEREVAIKVLPAEREGNAEHLARFEREAKILAALNHPNIAAIYEVGEGAGTPYLVMELVEGQTLDRLTPRGGLELSRFFDLAIPFADALAAAHDKGIIHRDLKPSNVMVNSEGRVKVLDFGLAKLHQVAGDEDETRTLHDAVTAEGRIVGTVSYMSPEQAEGKAVDHRSDIFSLGVVLYEMATGERPFRGDSATAVMSSILRDRPPSPSESRPQLPRHLGRIILQCLEKDPRGRFQSARDVYNGLRSLKKELDSDPSSSSSGVEVVAASRTTARRWVPSLVLAAILLLVGIWWAGRGGPSPEMTSTVRPSDVARPETPLVAVLPLKNLGPAEDEYFAEGITDEIMSRLATVRGLGVISSGSTSRYADGDARPSTIGEELGADFVLAGTVRWAHQDDGASRVRISPRLVRVEDSVHLWAEVYDRTMEDIFAIQSEIAIRVAQELGATLLEPQRLALERRPTENQEAYQAYLRGRRAPRDVRCSDIRSQLLYLSRAVSLDPTFVQAWAALSQGHAAAFSHCPERADSDRAASLTALEEATRLAPDSWEVLVARGQFLTQVERDYAGALEPLERASEQIDTAALHFNMGRTYRRQGRWEEALAAFRRAQELDPLDADRRTAAVLMWMRRYDEAIEEYDDVLEMAPDFDNAYLRKAWMHWLWKGDTVEARKTLEALPATEPSMLIQWAWFWQRVYEGHHREAVAGLDAVPDEPLFRIDIFLSPKPLLTAQALTLMDEPELARAAYEEARVVLEAERDDHPADANVRQALAIAYAGLGMKEDALREASVAMEIQPIDEDPYFGASTLIEVALVETMVGEFDAALEHLDTILGMPAVVSIPWLKLDPRWAPLVEHPRFRELVAKYG
jgi:serine/threonine protein kinase/tetratricopeptide (TPR) repeat protein